nr:hypothetical protein CFP56_03944 [Quercus suber]
MASHIELKSAHVHDPSIHSFLEPDFDTVDYLNATLPSLSGSAARSNATSQSVPLPELNTQLQTLLNNLNAQATRLSNALTQLTDEIVRIGGRLAYEVEVLRGETNSLNDTLANSLKKDVDLFTMPSASVTENSALESQADHEPEYLHSLHTLTTVRSRLDAVIRVFGDAMSWPLAPSEVSATASLISVSAPNTDDARVREAKGREYVDTLRDEMLSLLSSGVDGVEAAGVRIASLRDLAEVWKGTAEEKARGRVVEAWHRDVEEEKGKNGKAGSRRAGNAVSAKGSDHKYGDTSSVQEVAKDIAMTGGGYGFLQNLRNLKNDMYLD